MQSLGESESLNREQRDEMPLVLADLGPLAIPELMKYLGDERDAVRGVAAVALGRLAATKALLPLAELCGDPHEAIRACAVDALGAIGEANASPSTVSNGMGRTSRLRQVQFFLAASGKL